jgi:hypothetical protein
LYGHKADFGLLYFFEDGVLLESPPPFPAVPKPLWLLLALASYVVIQDFNTALQLSSPEQPLWMGYVFPLCVAGVLCLRIMPKYWIGFAWAGVFGHLALIGASLLDLVQTMSSTYSVLASITLLFLTQALILWIRMRQKI